MLQFNIVFASKDMSFNVNMQDENKSFSFVFNDFQTVTKDADYYQGNYEITPAITSQTLETKNKLMSDDVKINEIPFFETSNDAGGNTIYIGKEI